MKKVLILIAICIAVLFVVKVSGSSSPVPKVAGMKWDPIIDELTTKSKLYQSGSLAIQKKQQAIDQLQAEIADIQNVNAKLSASAAAYDTVLCTDYGVTFKRGTSGTGTIVKGCDTGATLPL